MSKRKASAAAALASAAAAAAEEDEEEEEDQSKRRRRREKPKDGAGSGAAAGSGSGSGSRRGPLTDYEKGVVQILLSCGAVEEKALGKLLTRIEGDFLGGAPRPDLLDTFKRINNNMRAFSLEVRSVRSKNDGDEWVTHFGLMNTEEDNVMKEHGVKNQYDDAQIRFFSTKLLPEFTLNKYLSTDEVNKLMPSGTVKSKMHEFLERLAEDKWLSRSGDRGFWELGPRSFLELRGHMESILRDSIDGDLDAAERARLYEERKNELPQILYY
jgi:hypothetical protein